MEMKFQYLQYYQMKAFLQPKFIILREYVVLCEQSRMQEFKYCRKIAITG